MSTAFDNAYRDLVRTWKRRDDLHRAHAEISELAAAHHDLDRARAGALRARYF